MHMRPEVHDDATAIDLVHAEAFRRAPDADVPPEVALTRELRASPAYIAALSLVADDEGVVGHVMATRATVGAGQAPVLGVGPLGVQPNRQRSGVGRALMRALITRADEMGEPMLVLLGSPDYYSRFGFELSSAFGIEPPQRDWAPHFQVRPGRAYDPALRGLFSYAEPFDRV
jgi:putative acetyltransferase